MWRKISYILITLLVFLSLSASVHAAGAFLYFSPSSKDVAVGEEFSVDIFVSSTDEEVNAVQGQINFPAQQLEITSVSTSDSVINFWIQEPVFSNTAGSLSFEGVILSPAFLGGAGKVMTLRMKGKTPGAPTVSFSSGAVLANDGKGTNILESIGAASFTIGDTAPPEPERPPEEVPGEDPDDTQPIVRVPGSPTVLSTTHPAFDEWYQNKEVILSWDVPSGVSGISTLFTLQPDSIPPEQSNTSASTTSFTQEVENGITFFHIRFLNDGGWGPTTHFQVNVDTEQPELVIEQLDREDETNPVVDFSLEAFDEHSEIEELLVVIDDDAPIIVDPDRLIYSTPATGPGDHTITFTAVDLAGNSTSTTDRFSVQAIEPPIFVDFPREITTQSLFSIRGQTIPKGDVTIILEGNRLYNFSTKSDNQGEFQFIVPVILDSGEWQLSGKVRDRRGASSVRSRPEVIRVAETGAGAFFTATNISLLLIVLASIIYLVVILLVLKKPSWLGAGKKKKKEKGPEKVSLKSLLVVQQSLKERISKLDGKGKLTASEKERLVELKERLKTINLYLRKKRQKSLVYKKK